ncbi:MAG: hypothetical protein C0597_10295, partial [Marinilabiliales bacterium]
MVDKFLEPKSIAYATVDTGIYDIIKYDDSGKYVRSINNYEFREKTEREKYGCICVDLEGRTTYIMVLTSYLYEATNSLAQTIHENMGKNEIIQSYYESDKPLNLTFYPLFPYEPLPKEIGAMDAGWALVPIT